MIYTYIMNGVIRPSTPPGRVSQREKGVYCMALWIIVIILAVVFAPILLGTAATLLVVAIPIVLLIFGISIIVSLLRLAAMVATDPAKCRSYGTAAMAVYVLLLLPPVSYWFFRTNIIWLYRPLLLAGPYALCLMILSKNRSDGGIKGRWGFIFWILGALSSCGAELLGGYYPVEDIIMPYSLLVVLVNGYSLAGLALLMTIPAHGETSPKEKSAVGLIAAGFMVECVWALLRALLNVLTAGDLGGPAFLGLLGSVVSYGTLLMFLVGTVQFARCHFSKGDPAEAEKPKK